MRLRIHHSTTYAYGDMPNYLIQRLLLEPAPVRSQRVLSWQIRAPGIENALRYVDGFGNPVAVITPQNVKGEIAIVADGEVEVEDTAGVVGDERLAIPESVFLRKTAATMVDGELKVFAHSFEGKAPSLERLHAMMVAVHAAVVYEVGTTHTFTTASEAFRNGKGVCQDHAHVMVALARVLEVPARYVTGYLAGGQGASSAAAHAWAEILVPDLGWVGFDAANGLCPTDQYVRLASGLDAASTTPIRGTRRGGSNGEEMRVEVLAEIAQQ
jgi:transglutaminase-like putative cysteine protease